MVKLESLYLWKLHRRKVEEKMARNKFLPINLKIKIKTISFPEI